MKPKWELRMTTTHQTHTDPVTDSVWKVMIPSETVSAQVRVLAKKIKKLIESAKCPVVLVFVGNGGFWLGFELNKLLPPHGYRWGVVMASSYGDSNTPGRLQMTLDALGDVEGCDVIVVDDIFDTGRTTSFLYEYLIHCKNAATVSICVLLEKPSRKDPNVKIKPDLVAFIIPDTFVAGCGLDGGVHFGYTRNFPDIRFKGEDPPQPWYEIVE